jgi:L-amino acid N-acyltransferase YncA
MKHSGAAVLAEDHCNRRLPRGPQLGMHSLVGLIFSHNEASIALFRAAGFKRWSFLPGVVRIDQTLAP